MNNSEVNQALREGRIDAPDVLPRLDEIRGQRFVFRMQFGLASLPEEPGLLLVRGARQYGKSTWLQQQVRETIRDYGPGTAFLLNGDEIRDDRELAVCIRELLPLYSSAAPVRRLFVDEITAVADWQRALKILADAGELRRVLVVTTGSKAADLRHGAERLPGRKGKLDRTVYLFTPVPFREFKRVCGTALPPERLLPAYVLSGGSPAACAVVAESGRIPEYVTGLVRDWIYGEFAASGRSRAMLLGVLECLYRFGGSPVGQSKLAREAGLANNTVAAGYIELLTDLMCVASVFGWDAAKRRLNRRQPCKFHLTNLLAAVAWHPRHIRSVDDYLALPPEVQSSLLEWQVAQELWRRAAVRGDEMPETMAYWRNPEHEIDFVLAPDTFIEVKRGKTSPFEFRWFPTAFPNHRLTVVSASRYDTDGITGVTMEDFLTDEG